MMDLNNKLRELRCEGEKHSTARINWEIRQEIEQKRQQVTELEKSVYESNLKIFQLQKELDNKDLSLKESEYNLKLSVNKQNILESTLKQVNESYRKLKIKDEIRARETDSRNHQLEQLSHANYKLTQACAEQEAKLKYYDFLHQEMETHTKETETALKQIKNNVQKMEIEHMHVKECDKKMNYLDEYINTNEFLLSEIQRLDNIKTDLQSKLVEMTDRSEKLDVENKSKAKQQKIDSRMLEYKAKADRMEQENKDLRMLLTNLEENLRAEIDASAELAAINKEQVKMIENIRLKQNVNMNLKNE